MVAQVVLPNSTSMSPPCTAGKRVSPVTGRMVASAGSPSTAAARARQESTSIPRQIPRLSGSEKGGLFDCMPQTTLPRARIAARVSDSCA